MSECPNCGSAEITFRYGKARWICGSHGHGADYFPHQTAICQLIRSLREELRVAKLDHAEAMEHAEHLEDKLSEAVEERGHLRVSEQHKIEELADARDAERDQIADWIENTIRKLRLVGLVSVAESYEQVLTALRNNRHRSNEHRSNT